MAARSLVRALKILLFVVLAVGGFTALLSSSQESGSGKPELHPTTLILDPASPVDQGRLVNVLAKFENSGNVAAAEFRVEFSIRLRPQGEDSASWNSFALLQQKGLSPDEQEVAAQGVLDTSNPALIPGAGIYEIRVVIDSNNQIPESDETNNELIVSLLVVPSKLGKPDLRPTTLKFSSETNPPHASPFDQSETVKVTATVVNTGDKDAGPFKVSFSYCRITQGQTSCATQFTQFHLDSSSFIPGGLPSGLPNQKPANATLSPQDRGLEPGIYLIKATVDPPDSDNPAGQIDEQDEANNELMAVLSIQGPELHPTSLAFNPPLPRLGDQVKVSTIVENSGQGTARNAEVAFLIDGAEFAPRQTVTLPEGGTALVEGILKTGDLNLEVGIHWIQIVVDPSNQISERDETNNEIRTAVTLQAPIPRRPELHPKSLAVNPRSPVELDKNLTLTLLSEVVNTGEVSARGFDIAFFYRLTGSVRWIPVPCTTNCVVSELGPGVGIVAEGKLNLVGITAGNYEVRVFVDPPDKENRDGKIKELDESNNDMKSAVTLLTARKPDLLIDLLSPLGLRFEPSSQVRRGTVVIISALVLNAGERAADIFSVDFCLRHIDEDTSTCVRQPVNGLGVGEQTIVRATFDTALLRPGPYELQIALDPESRLDELSEANNLLKLEANPDCILSPFCIRGSDLTVLSLQIEPPAPSAGIPSVRPGEQVKLSARIINNGVEAAGAFNVEFCRQREGEERCIPFGEGVSFPGLGVGVVVSVEATLDTRDLPQGRYFLQVIVDPPVTVDPNTQQVKVFGQVAEENERNNVLIFPLDVGTAGTATGAGQADLAVLSLTLTPEEALVGEIVEVRAEVANIGREGAGPFRVNFYWQKVGSTKKVNFAYDNVPGLDSGARKFILAQIDTSLIYRGQFEIIVEVDVNDQVKELNEGNNTLRKQLRVN